MDNKLLEKEEKIQLLVVEVQKEIKCGNDAKVKELMEKLNKEKEGYDELILKHFENRV